MNEITDSFEFDPFAFGNAEQDLNSALPIRYLKPPKNREIDERYLKYEVAEKLAADLVPSPGCRSFVVVNGSFYFGDFIEALIAGNNYHVRKLTISTLSMNENNVDSLANLLEAGFVDELNLIVSDYFFSHERQNLIPYLYQELDKDDKFQLAVAGTHCKLCLIETHCGLKLVLHGSANLRSSGNIEQFVLEECPALYAFNDEFQSSIIEQYKTINKPLRHKKLWQVVAPAQK